MYIKINAKDAADSADCLNRISYGGFHNIQDYTGAEARQSFDVYPDIPTEHFELIGQSRSR